MIAAAAIKVIASSELNQTLRLNDRMQALNKLRRLIADEFIPNPFESKRKKGGVPYRNTAHKLGENMNLIGKVNSAQ